MTPLSIAISTCLAACSAWSILGTAAILRVTHREKSRTDRLEPVTVLKPLAGADADLERNLTSFFEQDHRAIEIVFGITRRDDPARAVVERLRARFPEVPAKVIVHDGQRGMNPKVANLLGMIEHASHDVVLVSDSNVVVPRHYVREAVELLLRDERPGMVTHLFAGIGEDGLGAALENVQLTGFCAAGAALPTVVGDALVIGKSMMFSRRTLDALGGLERVADVLAEDWLLGKTFQHAGLPIRLAPTVLGNVTTGTSVRGFLDRQLRWAMIRARLRPVAQLLEVVTSPLALLPLAIFTWGLVPALAWCGAVLAVRDVGGWLALRGPRRAWIPLVLSPLREVLMLYVWARAPLKRHITWRGNRVRLGMGTYGFIAKPRRRPDSRTRRSSPPARPLPARPILRRRESIARGSSRRVSLPPLPSWRV
jgi:ceramide glucosyltransferase